MADALSSPLDLGLIRSFGSNSEFRFSEAETREQAEAKAQEFESLFLAELLGPVFDQLETDGPFGGGSAEEAFRPLLLEQYTKSISEAGGIGIADAVLTELLRLQGLEETPK